MTASLNALGVICTLGAGKPAVAEALFAGDSSGLRPEAGWAPGRSLPLGAVRVPLPTVSTPLAHSRDNRANRLLLAAALEIEDDIRAAITRYGASRIGVVLGTSTTGIERATDGIGALRRDGAWPDDYRYADQELGAPAEFLAEWLDLSGPCYGISTACTSGARALISAQRLLRMGMCDAVLCGGVDTLARLPINGFLALEALDATRCNPFSRHRRGINIGEAAALFLMTRDGGPVQLLGSGASSDAYHMSSPEPQGLGAQQAMRAALADAQLDASQIDYINLHGTATEHNDRMESHAVAAVFPQGVPCSSSKSMTGHTLGAAGALEAAFCWLSLVDDPLKGTSKNAASPQCLIERCGSDFSRDKEATTQALVATEVAPTTTGSLLCTKSPIIRDSLRRRLPPHVWDGAHDPVLAPLSLTRIGDCLPTGGARRLMSNSFAFGGNNACLILGDALPETSA